MFFINLNFLFIFTLFRILDISTTIVGMKTLDIPVLNPIMASMYENNFPLVILFNVIFVLIFLVAIAYIMEYASEYGREKQWQKSMKESLMLIERQR